VSSEAPEDNRIPHLAHSYTQMIMLEDGDFAGAHTRSRVAKSFLVFTIDEVHSSQYVLAFFFVYVCVCVCVYV
jgi:hypothetical protein